jgi:hypothetical protein
MRVRRILDQLEIVHGGGSSGRVDPVHLGFNAFRLKRVAKFCWKVLEAFNFGGVLHLFRHIDVSQILDAIVLERNTAPRPRLWACGAA